MARGVNRVTLLGRLGKDPETRTFDWGSVTNISLATEEHWKDRQTGEQKSRTEWHRVVFRNRLAEIAAEYLQKGSQCYIEGKLQTRKYQGRDGSDRYTTEVVAWELQLLSSRGEQSRGSGGGGGGQSWPQQQQQQQPADDFDDIPF